MKEIGKRQREKLQRVLCVIWYCFTAVIMVWPYQLALKEHQDIEICILKLLYSFLIMDILCSILEDIPLGLQKLKWRKKQKEKKRREEKEKELQQKMQEQIQQEEEKQRKVLEGSTEYQEVEQAENVYETLMRVVEEQKLGKKENQKLNHLLEEIQQLLEILKEDNTHYEKAGYMLRVCLPELKNITNIYLDMLSVASIQEEDTDKYCSFLTQFKKYIESIKEQIYSTGKVNLEINTSVMEKVMKSRMKNDKEETTL